jgi:hypothetical protein
MVTARPNQLNLPEGITVRHDLRPGDLGSLVRVCAYHTPGGPL